MIIIIITKKRKKSLNNNDNSNNNNNNNNNNINIKFIEKVIEEKNELLYDKTMEINELKNEIKVLKKNHNNRKNRILCNNINSFMYNNPWNTDINLYNNKNNKNKREFYCKVCNAIYH